MNTWGEFCELEEFTTNIRVIIFCRELKGVMNFFLKKIEKKGEQKKQIHCDEVKRKKKCGVSFVD